MLADRSCGSPALDSDWRPGQRRRAQAPQRCERLEQARRNTVSNGSGLRWERESSRNATAPSKTSLGWLAVVKKSLIRGSRPGRDRNHVVPSPQYLRSRLAQLGNFGGEGKGGAALGSRLQTCSWRASERGSWCWNAIASATLHRAPRTRMFSGFTRVGATLATDFAAGGRPLPGEGNPAIWRLAPSMPSPIITRPITTSHSSSTGTR